MDSESDWDTQSEAAHSPRLASNSSAALDDVQVTDSTQSRISSDGLFIDYSQPQSISKGNQHVNSHTKQVTSTPRQNATRQSSATQSRREYPQAVDSSMGGVSTTGNMSLRHSDEDDRGSVRTVIQRHGRNTPQNKISSKQSQQPPYDFSNQYQKDHSQEKHQKSQVPGQNRKGHLYDPQSEIEETDDEAALAELRAGMQRGKQVEEQVRRQQQETHIRKQTELKAELTELPRDEMGVKEKAKATFSNFADKIKSPSNAEMKQNSGSPTRDIKNPPPFVGKEKEGSVLILPFEEAEREFFRTSEIKSSAFLPAYADRVENASRRMWQEIFALVRIVVSVAFTLVLELTLFLLRDIIYRYILRLFVAFGDFIVKPILVILFNGYLQPLIIFMWNLLIGIRQALGPIISLVAGFGQQIAHMLGSFRLVEVNWRTQTYPQNYNHEYNNSYIEESDYC